MTERVFSARRLLLGGALVAIVGATALGCGADDTDTWYLGAVTQPEAGPVEVDAGHHHDAATPQELSPTSCEVPPVPVPNGNALAAVQTLDQRAVLTTQDSVRVLELSSNGCPGQLVSEFGEHGVKEIHAIGAIPLTANRTVVAMDTGLDVLDATATTISTCKTGTSSSSGPARLLTPTSGTSWVTTFRGSPLWQYEATVGGTSPDCRQTGQITLSPAPFVVTALARSRKGGWLAVQQQDETSPLRLTKYGPGGKRVASHDAGQFHLCSGTWVTDSPKGYWVVDGACRQIVLFHSDTMTPVSVSHFDTTPLSAAWVETVGALLVPTNRFGSQGGVVAFMTIAPNGS